MTQGQWSEKLAMHGWRFTKAKSLELLPNFKVVISVKVIIAVMKHNDQKKLRKGFVPLLLPHHSSSS